MRETLRARLRQIGDQLARDRVSAKKPSSSRLRSRNAAKPADKKTDADGLGGGEQRNVNDLIALIESTIAPDSWQSRGGNGSISYFSTLKVLVVRQTDEVHRQVGGLLEGVRKVQ